MRAILAGIGTSGDFEPMLALAIGLRRRGHDPVLANSPDFAGRAHRHEIPFVPLGPPLAELGLTRCLQEILADDTPLAQAHAMLACVVPAVPQMVHELERACTDADILVCLPYQLAGFMAHERTGIPYVAWSFSPFGALPGQRLDQATSDVINHARVNAGLAALPDPFGSATTRSRLALFAASRHVFRRLRNWPAHYHLTGYFFVDETWEADREFATFLESGPRPIVVTFGSMRHPDPAAVSRIVIEAIERAGCRAIVQAGWSGLGLARRSPAIHLASGFIPHGWLFRRAACVIHHGAAGTTAAALRAGVPSIIVPHALDQFLWADLMHACGAATSPIPFAELSVERLTRAIQDTLTMTSHERLVRLTAAIREEGGIDCAIALLEQTEVVPA